MRIESDSYIPIALENQSSSGFVTIECKPYHARLSPKACAMRYAKAKGYDEHRYRGKVLRFQALEEQQIHSLHCLHCTEGNDNFNKYGKAQGRAKKIVSSVAAVKVSHALRNGKHSSKKKNKYLGFTAYELRKHMENQFKPGMSWDNYGEWEVDHIIPISAFHYESVNDPGFKQCWALANLQPLWSKANRSKYNTIQSPF
jgi:hypothetical protein